MSTFYRNQQLYGYDAGTLNVAAGTTTTTLRTCKNQYHTIFVQRIHVEITTASAGKTWTIKDSNGTPLVVSGPYDTDTAPTSIDIEFGEQGRGLTQGKDLVLTISAAGAVGSVTWEAYQKLTAVISLP